MDIKQLRSFVAIVDYRNFSKAAAKLNISQASVSTHLLQLEKELDITLLNRNTKTMEVTDAGWAVYKYASQILEMERCVIDACSAGTRRIIRIGASAIPATYILPDVLRQYGELFPNDLLKVKECECKAVIEGLMDDRFDVGLTSQPVQRAGLTCTALWSNRTVLITPVTERYLQMKRQGTPIAELLKEPVILLESGSDFFPNAMGIDPERLDIVARVNDCETVKHMVSAGMGIAVIGEVAARDFVRSHRLLSFDLPQFQQSRSIYLIHLDGCTPKDRIWPFVDYLQQSNNILRNK